MKKSLLVCLLILSAFALQAQTIEQVYYFDHPMITSVGSFNAVNFRNTQLSGLPGEPMMPYQAVSLILPPGEVASSMEIIGEMETEVPGSYTLYPQQHVRPLSEGSSGMFIQNHDIYAQADAYPPDPSGHLMTQYLNGYSVALTSFTPVIYKPASGKLSYFQKVTVRITTSLDPAAQKSLKNLSSSATSSKRLETLVQNLQVAEMYPKRAPLKSTYQILIITTDAYGSSFQQLIDHYQAKGITTQVTTTQTIESAMTGQDLQEKIRNYIIQEYQSNGVEYILLGGDAELVPYRGFYCQVQSSSIYEDSNIPSDLYYSALDGTWNTNGNNLWGEPGEDDLLPEVAVTRFPFSTETEVQHMIHKSVSYQSNPVPGDLQQPFLAAEHLYDNPMTFGGDYLDLLIDEQTANGYYTHGIPSSENAITKLYDTLISLPNNIFNWDVTTFLNEINMGKSFIHHVGHANETYVARLFIWDITNQNFSQVNGIDHNYTLMYSHGCLCGAFDVSDCIAEKMVTIENFLVGGVFNSRYGWFNEGQTEGPSAHIHREFVSALYNDTTAYKRIGETHMISKIKTAPWVTAPGQWEPGALRWCFYDCNVFGDPAMEIWTDDPMVGVSDAKKEETSIRLYPNPAVNQTTLLVQGKLPDFAEVTLTNTIGQQVCRMALPSGQNETSSIQLDLTGTNPGIYIVAVTTQTGTKSLKLIIHK
ncbi:MAG: T9SS type A sorting domain-containing protein [Bacteroidales bacterium]|nr:T9SS type A sorting domain-containing protein [Bacteroidales bacterium]